MSNNSNQIFTDITLDVSGKSSLSNISANQGNIKSHFVKAKLRDGTQAYIPPSTATGLVSFLTPRNTKIYEDVVSISGDTVTFELTESMLGTAGMGLCDISIIDNSSVLMSATVKVNIKPKAVPNDDDIVKDTDEYNVLANALVDVQGSERIRNTAENVRESNENARINNEGIRKSNEVKRQQDTATAIINVETVITNANDAITRADEATGNANDAADRANTSADNADLATGNANTVIANAETAITNTEIAISNAETATQGANDAANNAIDTATNLETTYSPRLADLEDSHAAHLNDESPHIYGNRFEWVYNVNNDSLDLVVIG